VNSPIACGVRRTPSRELGVTATAICREAVRFLAEIILLGVLAIAIASWLAGCTAMPVQVVPKTASWDGTNQNSGIVCTITNGQGSAVALVVTPHFVERFKALSARWSTNLPAASNLDGAVLTVSNTYVITAHDFTVFRKMNAWQKVNPK